MPSSNGSFGRPSIASDGIQEIAVTDFSMRIHPSSSPTAGSLVLTARPARSRGRDLLKQVTRLPLDRRRQFDVEVIHEPFAEDAELGGVEAPDRTTRDRALVDRERCVLGQRPLWTALVGRTTGRSLPPTMNICSAASPPESLTGELRRGRECARQAA